MKRSGASADFENSNVVAYSDFRAYHPLAFVINRAIEQRNRVNRNFYRTRVLRRCEDTRVMRLLFANVKSIEKYIESKACPL